MILDKIGIVAYCAILAGIYGALWIIIPRFQKTHAGQRLAAFSRQVSETIIRPLSEVIKGVLVFAAIIAGIVVTFLVLMAVVPAIPWPSGGLGFALAVILCVLVLK